MAFDTAENPEEYLTLGIASTAVVAHVVRDLPFTLFELFKLNGAVRPTEHDHDEVNVFLEHTNRVYAPEITARFDPDFEDQADAVRGLNPDNDATFAATVKSWRDDAFADAVELWNLHQSGEQAGLAAKAQEIEDRAEQQALDTRALYRFDGPVAAQVALVNATQGEPPPSHGRRHAYFLAHRADDVPPIPGPDGEPIDDDCRVPGAEDDDGDGDGFHGHHHDDDHDDDHAHHSHGDGEGHDHHHHDGPLAGLL